LRAIAEHVSAIEAERKKGDEIVGVGAGGSGNGHEDEATPERIHVIRFAGMGKNAKKKKFRKLCGRISILSASNSHDIFR
jgi:hypothetical protein